MSSMLVAAAELGQWMLVWFLLCYFVRHSVLINGCYIADSHPEWTVCSSDDLVLPHDLQPAG